MLFIAYTFKGQVHVFAGRVKIKSLVLQDKRNTEIFLSPVICYFFVYLNMYVRLPAGCTIEVIGS